MDRYKAHIANAFDINDHNHRYPRFRGDNLPLVIRTPFKYLRQPAHALGDDHLALVVQQEGGESFGEEQPCHEILLLLQRRTDGIYHEVDEYWLGREKNVEGNEWFLVDGFGVKPGGIIGVSWWRASRYSNYKQSFVSSFAVRDSHLKLLSSALAEGVQPATQ